MSVHFPINFFRDQKEVRCHARGTRMGKKMDTVGIEPTTFHKLTV
jgi:hypothetical protein